MGGENIFTQLPILPYLLIFGIFWFILIKPQRDKEKKRKEAVNNLIKNDKVITAGGIHGSITLVKETTVVLRVDDNTKIEFDKESINTVLKSSDKTKEKSKKK